MTSDSVFANAARGGAAGAIATVAMTAAMIYMHRRLPAGQRYGLPPEHIVDELLERAEADDQLSHVQSESLCMAVHHGYGTAMGAVYGALTPQLRLPPIASGAGFGIAVWAAGYLGWLPAMKMDASATREPWQRNALTLAAHLVWGSVTGILTGSLHGQACCASRTHRAAASWRESQTTAAGKPARPHRALRESP